MRSGVSPERTSTSPAWPSSAARAARTASPVPSGVSCTATVTPLSANSSRAGGRGDDDERVGAGSRARRRSPSRPCGGRGSGGSASARRSASGCRGLRPSRRLRGGCRSSESRSDGWGARIRTWDRGTKTRCLTAWLRPTAAGDQSTDVPVEEEDQCGDREQRDRRRSRAPSRPRARSARRARAAATRRRSSSTCRRGSERCARPAYHQKTDARSLARATAAHQCRTCEEVEQPLDRGDPERDPQAPLAQPAARTARAGLDRVRPDTFVLNRTTASTGVQSRRPGRRGCRRARRPRSSAGRPTGSTSRCSP